MEAYEHFEFRDEAERDYDREQDEINMDRFKEE